MSNHGPDPYIENFIWEHSRDRYPAQPESNQSHKGKDNSDDSVDEDFYDETIHQFIGQFCIKQIKNRVPLKNLMNTIEKVILTKVLSRLNGHQKATAQFLKIKSTTLHEKLKKHHIRFSKIVQ
jgi:DNA-binding NtrC family response regulator